ncbi:universal stress protein [Streptomyces canus]|uniref:universal stress protein n=1 Tax=Streptomyces canus TaxID=58343 RepID=UPI003CEF6384
MEFAMGDRVIVEVDGSAAGLDAVDLAAREAQLRRVSLHLVHALGRSSAHLRPDVSPWSRTHYGSESLVHGALARAEERAHVTAPDIEVTRAVVVAHARDAMEIESRRAALAVVGDQDLSRLAGLLGSTAVHLAAHGHCPLLMVRGRPRPVGPVLLAVDGSRAGEASVGFAFAEAALRQAPLVALHVWNSWSEGAYEGPSDPLTAVVTDVDHVREAEQHMLRDTVAPWQEVFPQAAVERRLVRARIRPTLIDASRHAQLVVAGARGRGGFTGSLLGSVSQALLRHADCPVAVVRGKE